MKTQEQASEMFQILGIPAVDKPCPTQLSSPEIHGPGLENLLVSDMLMQWHVAQTERHGVELYLYL